jgi:hypothetical protein
MENIKQLIRQKYTLSQTKESVKDIVRPRFMRLSLSGIVDTFNSIPEEYRTDWSKLLKDVKTSKNVLSNLIKGLFGVYGGRLTYIMDLDTNSMNVEKDVTMVFASTPDKKQQSLLVDLFREVLGPQYIVELINSDETSNREVEDQAKKTIAYAKENGKKVVFVSKDMASRSFSISEIDTVILMFDRGSYSTITQKVSRVLTPGVTYKGLPKTHGNIISLSLDPNREDVSPIDEYIVYESEKVQVNDLNDGLQRVLKSMDIFTNDNGDIEPIEVDVYADKLINSSTLIKLGCETSKVDKVIVNSTLVKMLLGIEVSEVVKEKLMGIDSSKVKRTKDGPQTKNEKELEKKVEDIRMKIKKVLDNIVENAVEISEINNCESDDIIETLTMIDNKGYCNEVIHEVGIDCEMVKQIIMIGGLSYKLLNTIISSYNKEKVVLF